MTGWPVERSWMTWKLFGSLGSKVVMFSSKDFWEGRTQLTRTARSDSNLQKSSTFIPSITVWLSDWSIKTKFHQKNFKKVIGKIRIVFLFRDKILSKLVIENPLSKDTLNFVLITIVLKKVIIVLINWAW